MIREGTIHLTAVPLYSLGPGIALLITVFAFNLVGDGLRDALDPRAAT
jgi:peptide/nickel transport system permease protein